MNSRGNDLVLILSTISAVVLQTGFQVAFCLCLVGTVCVGCGAENKLGRQALSGKVIFDGTPLEDGTIEFAPQDPMGVSSGGSIRGGVYEIAAAVGVPPGQYIVRIMSPMDVAEPMEPEVPPGPQAKQGPRQPPPATERIPPEFNTKSVQMVEVTNDGPNEFHFDIPARKRR